MLGRWVGAELERIDPRSSLGAWLSEFSDGQRDGEL
jgi:hypothetical protein